MAGPGENMLRSDGSYRPVERWSDWEQTAPIRGSLQCGGSVVSPGQDHPHGRAILGAVQAGDPEVDA